MRLENLLLAFFLASTLEGPPESSGCTPTPENFTIVLLPDPQYYSEMADDQNNLYYRQTQWIVDNRDAHNIKMVIPLGDLTDNSTTDQWTIADKAFDILDVGEVPYTAFPGNHDFPHADDVWTRDATNFNQYFGVSRFQEKPWYGGHYGSGNENNYVLFEEGGLKFLILSLEFAPRKSVLCWAEDLIRSYPDRRVIIATHCYQTVGGGHNTGCATEYELVGGNGDAVWDELASRHSNVFMVLSGHVTESAYTVRTGNTGNAVHEIITDYQQEAPCGAQPCSALCDGSNRRGNGWLRTLEFRPSEDRVLVSSRSVMEGNTSTFPNGVPTFICSQYSADPASPDHTFSVPYDMTSVPAPYAYSDQGSSAYSDRTVNIDSSGQQLEPAIAVGPDGGHVVVWEDDSNKDGSYAIMGRGFTQDGCESLPQLTISTNTAGQARKPDLDSDGSGNVVVVWEDDRDDNGIYQIRGSGFAADGTPRFSELTVNSVDTGQQYAPRVAMDSSGGFVVVWKDDAEKDGNYQIFARGFNADGTQRFADLQVNVSSSGQHVAPDVAVAADGSFVVVWQDDHDGNGVYQIYARGFLSTGVERMSERYINSVADGQQRNPVVACTLNGDFVVAWEDDSDGNGKYELKARGLTSSGEERFHDFTVNGTSTGQQKAPALATNAAGEFVVVWEDDTDNNDINQLHARGFDALALELLPELVVNQENAGQQRAPSVAMTAGGVVFAWQDDMDNNGTYQILARGLNLP